MIKQSMFQLLIFIQKMRQRKTLNLLQANKTISSVIKGNSITPTSSSTLEVRGQLSEKYKTFSRWSHREVFKKRKKSQFFRFDSPEPTNTQDNILAALMKYTTELKKKDDEKKKNKLIIEELAGIKAQRRERFKKVEDPRHLIQHYMSRENFIPTPEQDFLIEKIVKLKDKINAIQNFDLNFTLSKIYKIMNATVDLNEMRVLLLLILLTAEICYEVKDMHRAFFFYNQGRIAATYTNLLYVKLECLIRMAKASLEFHAYRPSFTILKKSLQYAWNLKDQEAELKIYDLMGQIYYYQGNIKMADYYHNRSIQATFESNTSAVKKISQELLFQYQKNFTAQHHNLSELFIEYLDLPITSFKKNQKINMKKVYDNYRNGQSPRKNREDRNFQEEDFIKIELQIKNLFQRDEQFQSEIPEPDIQRVFEASNKFGKKKSSLPFHHTPFYHKIVKIPPPSHHCTSEYKLPIEQKVKKVLSEKVNPHWWENIIYKTRQQKQQKVGKLRDRVRKTHLSYHKYPEQRRRAHSLKTSKIGESINKTILDMIDPIK